MVLLLIVPKQAPAQSPGQLGIERRSRERFNDVGRSSGELWGMTLRKLHARPSCRQPHRASAWHMRMRRTDHPQN
ncbi:hypothetical protein RALTA_A1949 [Cupriavidus taiwanensis LMG 19424]|uniref:Uncharacterized protein n=1 Tax=Cupriavidus taiwanensis (strain DSM 17343 / BCRC 17206 / CCUG 44338 / CIP 107171 / LMG 19424 / R1) TaxID=977880 RepID=B3R1P2_CUPTR|nr:hypothetical protein RALTA_A1949 [Cupriavidus taiwanensis LMG 19424]